VRAAQVYSIKDTYAVCKYVQKTVFGMGFMGFMGFNLLGGRIDVFRAVGLGRGGR
jgi:hypothetical protein